MQSLTEVIAADPDRNRISRIVVEPGPIGRATIRYLADPVGRPTMPDGSKIPLRSADSPAPPVTLRCSTGNRDVAVTIRNSPLEEQLSELERSGLVGRLNVERVGPHRRFVISTHAGTQAERTRWIMDATE